MVATLSDVGAVPLDELPAGVQGFAARLSALWVEAVDIWVAGGWAMWGIALVALVMFALGLHVLLELRGRGFLTVPERVWRRWIDHPDERHGPIGELIRFVTDGGGKSDHDIALAFAHVRASELVPFERDLRVMKVCVSAAPLVGLLGTVMGMLTTFDALSSGSGGSKTMSMIASGISEALITTETGLVIAIPGLFLQSYLARLFEQYRAFLAHVETVCTQSMHRLERQRLVAGIRRQAVARIAAAVRARGGVAKPGRRRASGPEQKGAAGAPKFGAPNQDSRSEVQYGTIS
ncbi:MAG: MotA/TolQ/ExbB proton channel family protein [Planctomycetota bacterium]